MSNKMVDARLKLSPKDDALARESRAHWVRMRDDPEGCEEAPSVNGCALCGEYFSAAAATCIKCPVALVTGKRLCEGTPYMGASALHTSATLYTEPDTDERRVAVIAFQELADRVIAWIDEHLLADDEPEQTVVPEPEELRRLVIESKKANKESTEKIMDIICGHLPESCTTPVARPRLTPKDEALVRETRARWVRRAEEPTKSRASSWLLPCSLCTKYYSHGACTGCPVFSVSGQTHCRGTPYIQASALFRASDNHFSPVAFARAARCVIAWIDEHLLGEAEPEQRELVERLIDRATSIIPDVTLADDQQLPLEVTRAAEGSSPSEDA